MPPSVATLSQVGWPLRLKLHLLNGLAVFFLSIYGKIVCPFIDSITLPQVIHGLVWVYLFQIILREALYQWHSVPPPGRSPARHGFILSIFSWVFAGVAASLLHNHLYDNFHWTSHLKLLSGYLGLGAGILAQLEYILLEQHFRHSEWENPGDSRENFSRRLLEGVTVFTLTPALMMVLMSYRFVYEGFADKGAAKEVLFLGASFVLMGIFVHWRYGKALQGDCDHLTHAVGEIAQGRFQVKVDASRPDELGVVASGINDMAKGLALRERIREAFGRFVNPQVAEAVIQSASGETSGTSLTGFKRQVAVMMVDLRNFTPMAEQMDPEPLTQLLNAYFSQMVAAVQNHGGMVDKFMGDAVMAVFGLDEQRPRPAADAVEAALEMRQRLAVFNADPARAHGPKLVNGIGIHLGKVVAGYLGSADRLEFTVIGHTVNLAARIESQARAPLPSLLFSQEVADSLQRPVRKVTTTALKGVSGEVALYTTD